MPERHDKGSHPQSDESPVSVGVSIYQTLPAR